MFVQLSAPFVFRDAVAVVPAPGSRCVWAENNVKSLRKISFLSLRLNTGPLTQSAAPPAIVDQVAKSVLHILAVCQISGFSGFPKSCWVFKFRSRSFGSVSAFARGRDTGASQHEAAWLYITFPKNIGCAMGFTALLRLLVKVLYPQVVLVLQFRCSITCLTGGTEVFRSFHAAPLLTSCLCHAHRDFVVCRHCDANTSTTHGTFLPGTFKAATWKRKQQTPHIVSIETPRSCAGGRLVIRVV